MSSEGRQPRLAFGQLLLPHLRLVRVTLFAEGEKSARDAGVKLRMSHLHVFGNIRAEGSRLTDLAAMAGVTPPSMGQLIDELEADGLVLREPDPNDRRAKLVRLTPLGWDAIRIGRDVVARIEADYARRIGAERYEAMCSALQDLLDDLSGGPVRGAPDPQQRPPGRFQCRPLGP